MSQTISVLRMTGTCRNGAERDGGSLYHAVRVSDAPTGWDRAVCGKRPGRKGNGWSCYPGQEVTCPKCRERLAAGK